MVDCAGFPRLRRSEAASMKMCCTSGGCRRILRSSRSIADSSTSPQKKPLRDGGRPQFAFSELHKLRSGTRRPDKWTDFWAEADDLLTRAVLMQQVVLPHSNIHHSETIVSPFSDALRDTQEAIGGDIEFLSTDEVQFAQVEEFARAFFAADEPQLSFNVDDVLEGERNAWLPDMRISVGMNWSSFVPETRHGRASAHAGITGLVEGWKKSGWGFEEVLERELGAYLESRQEGLRHSMELFEKGLAENDPFARY